MKISQFLPPREGTAIYIAEINSTDSFLILQVAKQVAERNFLLYHGVQVLDLHALLAHRVAIAHGDSVVNQGVVVTQPSSRV